MGETCYVCGRETFPNGKDNYQANLCYRFTLPRDPECYRLGYEREKARADSAEKREHEFLSEEAKSGDSAREALAAEKARADMYQGLLNDKDAHLVRAVSKFNDALTALAAARRECEGLRKALDRMRTMARDDDLRYFEDIARVADAALAAPAAGEEGER